MAEGGRARERLAARNAVARALADTETESEAVMAVLAALGEGLGWAAALFWRPRPAGSGLAVVECWVSEGVDPSSLPDESGSASPGDPAGLSGRVWQTGRPAWRRDGAAVEGDGRDDGLGGALAVPVKVAGGVHGVVELVSGEAVEEDPELVETVSSAATQLGRCIERTRAKRALEESDEQLRFQASLLEAVGEAIIATDRDGKVMYWNAAAEKLYGWRADEVLGRDIGDVTPTPGSRGQAAEIMDRLRNNEPWTGEFIVRDRNQREFPVVVTNSPVVDANGEIRAIIGTSRDITRRKRSEEAQRFLAEAGRVLASSLDYTDTLEEVCRRAVPLMGDCCFIHLLPESGGEPAVVARCAPGMDEASSRRAEAAVAAAGGVLEGTLSRRMPRRVDLETADGSVPGLGELRELGVHEVLAVPLHARDHPLGAFTFLRTDEGEYDEADEQLAEELALRVSFAVDNGRLYLESEEGNRAKTDFLAVVSHELRTPLNAITGYADLLAGGVSGALSEDQARQVDRIKVGARHLAHLIDEVLAFARVDTDRESVSLSDADLAAVAREAALVLGPDAEEKSLSLELDIPEGELEVTTDPSKVRQILVNLLSNAVKYTEKGSVGLTVREVEDGFELAVTDTGVGIPPEEHERIFEPFLQVQSPNTRTVGGTGLGLSVSRRLAELLGGTLWLESEPGVGSTFTLHLPAAPPEPDA